MHTSRIFITTLALFASGTPAMASAPAGLLQDNGNGTVKDLATGLVWQAGYNAASSWADATATCSALSLDGGGWRLPTILEMATTVDETSYEQYNVFERPTTLTANAQPYYWASTKRLGNLGMAWAMVFRSKADHLLLDTTNYPAQTTMLATTGLLYSRCVR
jgi:hypothetical protein